MKPLLRNICIALISLVLLQANAKEGSPRLHPLESACVEYQLQGPMQKGTRMTCFRNYGHEKYETQKTTIGIGDLSKSYSNHTVTLGDTIYAINVESNTVTKSKNSMYQKLVKATQNVKPEDIGMAIFDSMDFVSTGRMKTIAGMPCKIYKSSMLGMVCMSKDALMLEQAFGGSTTKAVNIRIGESGDERLYELHKQSEFSSFIPLN